MPKEHGPGMFGRREDVEGAHAREELIHAAGEGLNAHREALLRSTKELSAEESRQFDEAEGIVDAFVFRHFAEHIPKIQKPLVRTSGDMNASILMNEFIALPRIGEHGDGPNIAFIHAAVHEILHFYSARRLYAGKENIVSQVGLSTTAVGKTPRLLFEGLNEALISSLQHRLVYAYATADDSEVPEEVKRRIKNQHERSLERARNEEDPMLRLVDQEVYPVVSAEGGVYVSTSYMSERVLLRFLLERAADASEIPHETLQEQFDRVTLYGWDDESKRVIIGVVGPDIWRALAWMRVGECRLDGPLTSDYRGLLHAIVTDEWYEADQIAREIMAAKRQDTAFYDVASGDVL